MEQAALVSPSSHCASHPFARRFASLTVIGLMLLFAAWFSAYGIRQHDAQLTHKSDLGQMDQAIWNTAHGRFVVEIKEDRRSTRMTDHVEPIFALISLVFWVWDDVRALLVLQALALAAGAWPIFLFARKKLANAGLGEMAEWGGMVFAAAYLLAPQLQAAAVAEFHAMPFAAPLIAAALWAVEKRSWSWFALWAILLALVQEGAALLTATLGLYVVARSWYGLTRHDLSSEARARRTRQRFAGSAVCLIGLIWFSIATFVIIPHYADQQYALLQTPYASRYGELGDSFSGVILSLFTRPGAVLRLVLEPLRVQYLLGLMIPTAALALLGPELLLVAGPLLLANLLSSYVMQYSGELHYSAPLVPFFVAAGATGAARLWRKRRSQGWTLFRSRLLPTLVLSLVVACALIYQVAEGFTPIGGEFRRSPSRGWPQVTAHERLLARFSAQIPPAAPLSTTPALHPHFTHRQFIYLFPVTANADYVLVDVTGTTDMHPNDVKLHLEQLLTSGEFGVVDAADGYLLLARGVTTPATGLPDAFFSFARAQQAPQHSLDVTFGGRIRLLGYDVIDNPKWRLTHFRLYWQIDQSLAPGATLGFQVLTPTGDVVDDAALRSMPALLWYPPERWQPGETVSTESVAWYLPRSWAIVLAVTDGNGTAWPKIEAGAAEQDVEIAPDGRLRLPPWVRRKGVLTPLVGASDRSEPVEAQFTDGPWTTQLTGWAAPRAVAPGHILPVALRWSAAGPAGHDYQIFLHLRGVTGNTVAMGDAGPTWFVPRPASRWPATADGAVGQWTAHVIVLPDDLAPGRYDLVVGWYDWQTGERLALRNHNGEEYVLGSVTIDVNAAPQPDLACQMLPESCAGLE